jgi:Domain of unknown function (DUF4917)
MTATILNFEQAIKLSEPDTTVSNVLLGNGFSIASAGGVFSYDNLLSKCNLPELSPIRSVFDVLGTCDFEEVMRALEHAARIEEAYGDTAKSTQFQRDAETVREALISRSESCIPPSILKSPVIKSNVALSFSIILTKYSR